MKNNIICMTKGLDEKKRIMSLLLTILIVISLIAVPVSSSAATCIQPSISSTEVFSSSCSSSYSRDIKTLVSGSTYCFNLDGDSTCKLKSVQLYVRQANESSYKCVYNYTSKESFYNVSKSLQINGTGTLQYYWKVKYADVNRTETIKTVKRTVVERTDISESSVIWNDSAKKGYRAHIRSNW